jgi:hypothetical protein
MPAISESRDAILYQLKSSEQAAAKLIAGLSHAQMNWHRMMAVRGASGNASIIWREPISPIASRCGKLLRIRDSTRKQRRR